MDATEIALEVEKQKNDPHFLDKMPASSTGKSGGGPSADSPELLEKFLPSKEQEQKKLDELKNVFDTTARAGVVGEKTWFPGIGHNKQARQFIDDHVGTGRFKPEPKPFSENIQFGTTANPDVKKPRVVIYDKCMDCMSLVSRDDCVPNMVFVPFPTLHNAAEIARWGVVQVTPGSVVCYIFCGDCTRNALKIAKDPHKQMPLIIGGIETTIAKQELHQRGLRIQNQVFTYLKNVLNDPDNDVYYLA